MRFKKLLIYTSKLESGLEFYEKTLGFKISKQEAHSFSVQVGWSELTFEETEIDHRYHYCFLIPANKLNQALEWMEQKTEIVEVGNGQRIQNFKSWNADSFYFYDGSRNIVEFIARYDLNNKHDEDFDTSKILCINEIGMPTTDIIKTNTQLESQLNTRFWKGDFERFGTHGSQEGIFLLPNYNLKDHWFPVEIEIKPNPFQAIIENEGKEYHLEFRDE